MFRYEEEGIPLISRVRKRWLPTRVLIGIMMFTACWTNYMLRLQMPILAVPMIKARAVAGSNITSAACDVRIRRAIAWLDPGIHLEDYILAERLEAAQNAAVNSKAYNIRVRRSDAIRPPGIYVFNGLPFDWRPEIRGQLIAAYSYGNVPGNLLGGMMAVKWGAKNAILWTSILAVTISFFSPILAQFHWGVLLFTRIIIGLTGGITFPACHSLVARWAPPNEKARFVWSLLGGTFGTIFTYPLVAGIAESLDWESGWYIPSLMMVVWIFFWALITYDSPEEHPGITTEEKEYIITEQAGTVRKVKPTLKQTPLKEIFTSIPFLSLIVCHFGNMFLLFFYQNAMMIYLTKALGFELTRGGVAAALPWLFRMVFGFFFSWAGDTLKRKNIFRLTTIRKGATIFSHFLPGVFFILVGYVGCRFVLANIFLMLALGFNGAASISNLSNNQDLSPNFAGFLYGIMNTIGCTSGFIISPLVEEIAGKYGNPIERWQTLFWIGAGVCIVCMIVFLIGGSGNIQPWNEVRIEEDEAET
ncbi:vesicular glutamate transporter 2.1 isoform X1 [Apis mellifera caucasica]|uniref:Vesicular glutamate transporter 2.1 isoform X1 n=1 Tax=Apis mellifera TaxID=7460 RepID=A0A7M7H1A1_APIME|nr:vesicular glutamate transporter 2.1 isoform X1 [Apis mellifera]KAG6798292.1 vesicular glutamate transporter 2.1 isoform X1 [Apis mellifera caucasica]|eukprot:XP_006566538.1 vesicular glutamate transporter 2.1 isoform X1 [Apis mellifera]